MLNKRLCQQWWRVLSWKGAMQWNQWQWRWIWWEKLPFGSGLNEIIIQAIKDGIVKKNNPTIDLLLFTQIVNLESIRKPTVKDISKCTWLPCDLNYSDVTSHQLLFYFCSFVFLTGHWHALKTLIVIIQPLLGILSMKINGRTLYWQGLELANWVGYTFLT